MSWLICLGILAVAAALFGTAWTFVVDDGFANTMFVTAIALAIIAVGSLFVMGARTVVREWDVKSCRGYAVYGDRQAKFVDYDYWTWDCLVWADGFGWVPKDQLRNTP